MANKELVINNPDATLEQKALGLLMCTAQDFNAAIARILAPLGVSYLQVHILHVLSKVPTKELTVNQIKKFMIDDSSNLSRVLNKLMDKKLIVKTRSDVDQRVVYIRINDAGEKMHNDADNLLLKSSKLNLTEDEIQKLYDILVKI